MAMAFACTAHTWAASELYTRMPVPAVAACGHLAALRRLGACSRRAASGQMPDHVSSDARLQPDACVRRAARCRYKRVDEDEATGFVGKGSYGKVYIAEDTLTGDVVAVKRQTYPSTAAAKELAFAKVVASNPSVPVLNYYEAAGSSSGHGGGWEVSMWVERPGDRP